MANWTRSSRRGSRRRHDPDELRRLIRRREAEGLSYARLSQETGIPVGTLAWWSHRLRMEESDSSEGSAAASDFVEVIATGAGRDSAEIEVRLPGGVAVLVPAGTDRSSVLRVLSALLSC